ncbi:hypothetical protein SCE1572_45010 [Sorangium cellulosum So0157-2]|uniref:Uncharacterized protein n=1 Tax=Sorangium cellulosum So0157-2 TaxID=1254432 RepID=S4Y6I6_SORCE|nr:hypothetical protein SCE1572_45010 [Sorangium cellulosum So0157-2]
MLDMGTVQTTPTFGDSAMGAATPARLAGKAAAAAGVRWMHVMALDSVRVLRRRADSINFPWARPPKATI